MSYPENWSERRPRKCERTLEKTGCPVKGGVLIEMGELMARDSGGFAVRCSEASATTASVLGVARETYDNRTGADGAVLAVAMLDTFGFVDSGDSAVGSSVYIVDAVSGAPAHTPPVTLADQVGTNGAAARVVQHATSTPNGPKAGVCTDISGGYAWISITNNWS